MATNIATVTAKGQITIPKAIRQTLGIQEKDKLLFLVEGEQLTLIPMRHRPLSELYGALPATKPYPGHQEIREAIHTELGERMKRGEE
jgi:AbrB family looped-hinge helix DNA binding protein